MTRKQKTERERNHERVPIMRSQIRALTGAAQTAHKSADQALVNDQAGMLLAAGMNAGFALELGLKLFYMTFHERAGWGHDLRKLFFDLPPQIQGDISESYVASLAASSLPATFRLAAFRTSQEPPPKPEGSLSYDITTAQGLFDTAWDAFERGRYFFDKVGPDDWAVTGYPIDHMLLMVGVLDVVYDEYIRRGGFGE